MADPTVTYGQGWQTDCDDRSSWSADHAHEDGMISTLSVTSGTVFDISVTNAVGNKTVYYELDISDLSSTSYGQFLIRYKTSNNNIRLKVVLVFTAGSQVVMPETSNETWTTYSATITTAKTIDKIQIWATNATGNVYIDFLMIYMGTQTFHDVDDLTVNPRLKSATLVIPGRDTNIKQLLGRDNTLITLSGPMRESATKSWGGSNLEFGEFLMDIISSVHFQWFTSDQGNFKVVPVPAGFSFKQSNKQGYQVGYNLQLEEYDAGDADVFGYAWYGPP